LTGPGKFPSKKIVPIGGNNGIVKFRIVKDLDLRSNHSRESMEYDDKHSTHTFLKNPKMHNVFLQELGSSLKFDKPILEEAPSPQIKKTEIGRKKAGKKHKQKMA
jgi:hypothetical protein